MIECRTVYCVQRWSGSIKWKNGSASSKINCWIRIYQNEKSNPDSSTWEIASGSINMTSCIRIHQYDKLYPDPSVWQVVSGSIRMTSGIRIHHYDKLYPDPSVWQVVSGSIRMTSGIRIHQYDKWYPDPYKMTWIHAAPLQLIPFCLIPSCAGWNSSKPAFNEHKENYSLQKWVL